jgi:hypothetical protein
MQEWALIAGEPRHVSDFAQVPPKERPPAICLECKQPVLFKCGSIKSYYVAHKVANEECEAAKGEGAEHYNAKLYLASVLRQERSLVVPILCARCNAKKAGEPLIFTYDDVQLEYSHPNKLRADIALLSKGSVCCAIEVYVSHRCEFEKVDFHQRSKLPCFEVSAERAQRWKPPASFRPSSIHGMDRWVCSACEERAQRAVELPTRQSEKNLSKAALPMGIGSREWRKVIGVRKIFFYNPPDNFPFEHTFITIEYVEFGTDVESTHKRLLVWESCRTNKVLCEVFPPYTELQREDFRIAYQDFLSEMETLYGSYREGSWQRHESS